MTDVLWVTPGYPWSGDPAGGVFYRTQAQAIARLGRVPTVVCPTPWAPWPLPLLRPHWRTLAASPRAAEDGIVRVDRPRYLNVPGEPSWAMPDRLIARAVWRVRNRWSGAALVHGHYAITGLAAWRVARRARLPLVLTFHGSDINAWPDQHPERLADLRAAARDARAVIAVSAALAERILALTGVTAVHLPLGSDHAALRGGALSRDEARRRLGLPEHRVIALFVGHLKLAKGVRELVDGLLEAGDPWFGVLVGSGPESGYGLSDPRAAGRLVYAGARPHDDVATYLSAADVLVLPSHREGLPTVLVEAGSLRVPVIASRVGGVPELLGSDRGTILTEISGPAVAASLRRFAQDRPSAAQAAERLAAHVTESHSVDGNAARLIEIYRSAAGDSA